MGKKKGKTPQGRAKQKQKAQKSNQSSPWQAGRTGRRDWSDDEDDLTFTGFRGFAQNNKSGHSTPASARLELRHRAIAFVSAGTNTSPLKDKSTSSGEDLDDDGDIEIDDSAIQTNILMEVDDAVPHQGLADMDIQDAEVVQEEVELHMDITSGVVTEETVMEEEQTLSFVVDTVGDESLAANTKSSSKPPVKRPSISQRSDSSEERVVFHGRRKSKVVSDPVVSKPAASPKPAVVAPHARPAPRTLSSTTAESLRRSRGAPAPDAWQMYNQLQPQKESSAGIGDNPSKLLVTEGMTEEWTPAPPGAWWRNKGADKPPMDIDELARSKLDAPPPASVPTGPAASAPQVQTAEDTIATLQADWKQTLRDKKASKRLDVLMREDIPSSNPAKSRRSRNGRKKGNRALRAALEDSGDEAAEAAYNDYMENLAAQLDAESDNEDGDIPTMSGMQAFVKTSGLAGPSLMVDGQEFAADEYLDPKLKTTKENGTVDPSDDSAWVSDPSDGEESDSEASGSDQSELEVDIEYSEAQMYEDEEDLRQRRIEAMEDEELARLFAKQEEFGIDADDLVIEAGDYAEGIGDVEAARIGLANISSLAFRQPRARGSKRGKKDPHYFPDATALADTLDQYGSGGFDIMDFDRPSLRPTKKGRKGKLPPELEAISDEELRDDMMISWENDRNKKRIKKLEREQQRMDGLLGKAARTGKPDLAAKYSTGMTIRQAFDELHEFLLHPDLEQRAFPPMAKSDRKALHEICIRLSLNSKSQGSGSKRFPVVTKTSRTPGPGDADFDTFVEVARSGTLTNIGHVYKLKNSMAKRSREQKGGRPGRGPGASSAATTLRNGEIVGASAAKIGAGSFGHKMMMKMGWTEGKGLGQSGEGQVDPVLQRMRFGTAGLG